MKVNSSTFEDEEFSRAFNAVRDAMILISDAASRVSSSGSGGLDDDHLEEIQEAADVLGKEIPLLREWTGRSR